MGMLTATSQGEQHAELPFRAHYRLTGGKARSNLRRNKLGISRIQGPWRSRYDLLQFIMYLLYDKIVGMLTKTTTPNCQGHPPRTHGRTVLQTDHINIYRLGWIVRVSSQLAQLFDFNAITGDC